MSGYSLPMGGMPMGAPMGGMPMGGMPMGGMPMGGMPMGGLPMGGMPIGARAMPMGGMPMGGMPVGGMPMGMPRQVGMPFTGQSPGFPSGTPMTQPSAAPTDGGPEQSQRTPADSTPQQTDTQQAPPNFQQPPAYTGQPTPQQQATPQSYPQPNQTPNLDPLAEFEQGEEDRFFIKNRTERVLECFVLSTEHQLEDLNRGMYKRPGNETIPPNSRFPVLPGTKMEIPRVGAGAFVTILAQSRAGTGDYWAYKSKPIQAGTNLIVHPHKFENNWLPYDEPAPDADPAPTPEGKHHAFNPAIPLGPPGQQGMGMPAMGMPAMGMPATGMMPGMPALPPVFLPATANRPPMQVTGVGTAHSVMIPLPRRA